MRSSSCRPTSKATALIAGVAVLALLTTACGDDAAEEGSVTTEAAQTTVASVATTAATVTTEAPTITQAADTTEVALTTDAPASTEAATTVADTSSAAAFDGELVGTFSVDAAQCADGPFTTGSYFQMIQLGGTREAGPFIPNADSSCIDPNYSALTGGTDGGLKTGVWQAAPDPAYDASGNGLVSSIIEPVTFFAVAFAVGTDPAEATPSIVASDGMLSGDLSAFTAYYGGASFNQGSPKPDGSGSGPVGTIDPTTGAYVLDWTSLIVGGSFDGFTGVWHLEGTFTPA